MSENDALRKAVGALLAAWDRPLSEWSASEVARLLKWVKDAYEAGEPEPVVIAHGFDTGRFEEELRRLNEELGRVEALVSDMEAGEPETAGGEFVEVPVVTEFRGRRWGCRVGFYWGQSDNGRPTWCFLLEAPGMPDFAGYLYERKDGTRYVTEDPRRITCATYRPDQHEVARTPVAVLFRKAADHG